MTRRAAPLMLAIALVAFASGCARKDASNPPLRFWQFWDTAAVRPLIKEFERRNPGIRVEVEQLTWASGLEKLQASIASGDQPDLCELGSTWVPRFSYEGVLEDLTPVYAALADSFIMWDSAMWKGKCYGLPWVQGTRVLFYNVDLYEDAGFQAQWPPQTWAQLLDAAQRIDGLGDDIRGFGLNLGERYVLYKKFMAFAWGNGGAILDPDGRVVYNSLENMEALDFYNELARFSLKEKQEVLDHAFKSGELGMQISGAWNIRNYRLEAPDLSYRVALVPKPSFKKGRHASFAGAEMLVIFRDSKRKADALKLARFLQSYDQAKSLCLAVKSVFPASRRVLADPDFVQDMHLRIFIQQALTAHTAPAHPGWIDMEDIINRSVEEVLYGRKRPKDALNDAATELKAVVGRFEPERE